MKLSNDNKLVDFLVEKNKEQRTAYGEKAMIKLWLSDADQYLEEHGFNIYPVKKEKGTVSFKEVEPRPSSVDNYFKHRLREIADEIEKDWIEYRDKNFPSKEEKPSADGEENKGIWNIPDGPMGFRRETFLGIKHFIELPKEENNVSFVPWMKCPVCDGWGSRFDTGPLGSPTNVVSCACCDKSGVIPMQRITK